MKKRLYLLGGPMGVGKTAALTPEQTADAILRMAKKTP